MTMNYFCVTAVLNLDLLNLAVSRVDYALYIQKYAIHTSVQLQVLNLVRELVRDATRTTYRTR